MRYKLRFLGLQFEISVKSLRTINNRKFELSDNMKLNFGPGPNWEKPNKEWLSIDIDPKLGDVVVDFQEFQELPFQDNSVDCVYGSHVFEHMSIFKTPLVFSEIYRVLKKDGVFRLILPDAEKSIKEYVAGNVDFLLFKRRKERAGVNYNKNYTLFECLKEDFLSPSGQANLLGKNSLAHQNAWDYETIYSDLVIAGFDNDKIKKMSFRNSQTDYFSFEGTYPSEANEDYRSLYVEAIK